MTQEIESVRPTLSVIIDARPDLVHPFQCRPGEESRCSYFHTWLGGQVMCGMKESDPIRKNGPHLLNARNGEIAYCLGDPAACEFCARESDGGGAISWEERNLQVPEPRRPRKRLVDMTGTEFGEACSDMAKAIERSRR
jgi:hypothetical protein